MVELDLLERHLEGIGGDLRHERVEAVELGLGAEIMVERDVERLAVKVTVEVEEIGLEQLLPLEHRPLA